MNVMKKYLESFVKDNEIFIIDHWDKIYLTKTVNSDLDQIRVPSINRNIIFYEPSRKKYRFKRKIVTDIRGIKLGFSKKHLFINLFFLNNYSSKQKFKIRAIIITKGKSRVKSRDFELTIPAKSNSEFILNQYINSKKWLTRDMVHVYWRKESIKIRIDNPAFQKESYFFLTAEICKKGRIVDRTSWMLMSSEI